MNQQELGLKTGKLPFEPSPHDFTLSATLPGVTIPEAPPRFGHGSMYRGLWGMFGNDIAGDCVFAGFAHQAMISSKLGRHPETFTTENVLGDYSAVTGYDPKDPSTDQGTNVRNAMSYWRHNGIHTADGGVHQVGAYISIQPQDWELAMACAYTFSSVGMGWNVPSTIWDQWKDNEPFDVVTDKPQMEGGHYTVISGRVGRNIGGMITWGRRKSFTKEFYEAYNDETWAVVFPDELRAGKNIRGFDLTQLNQMLKSLEAKRAAEIAEGG